MLLAHTYKGAFERAREEELFGIPSSSDGAETLGASLGCTGDRLRHFFFSDEEDAVRDLKQGSCVMRAVKAREERSGVCASISTQLYMEKE